jgi:hypothetical protein
VEDKLPRLLHSLDDTFALSAQYLFQRKERLSDSLDLWKWARFQHASLAVPVSCRPVCLIRV